MHSFIKTLIFSLLVFAVVITPAIAAFNIDLHPGQDHPQVKTLQQLLNNNGYIVAVSGDGSKGFETTIMGPATLAALKRFQIANNINPTGAVGPLTRIALNRILNTTPSNTSTVAAPVTSTQAPAASPFVLIDLHPGQDHPQVKVLQQLLNQNGYTVAVTGEGSKGLESTVMGPATVMALIRFQFANNIDPTGTVGPLTRLALLKMQLNNLLALLSSGGTTKPTVTSPTATSTTTTVVKKKRSGGGGSSGGGGGTSTPAPVATLTVSSGTVASGTAVTVTWSATNATSCTGTNFSTGSATSGSTVVNPTASTTYSVSCTGTGGTDVEAREVTVSGTSNITLSAEASRVSGVAPLAVFFDATETTDTDTTQPFSDLEYRWNFDDASSGTWDFGARPGVNSRNEATGGIAAHVFETPGTYTVSVDVTGESGTESDEITITVTDPDTVFAGTATRCISRVGDFTGCPSGAEQVTTTDMAVAESHIATGRRILFKRGETWGASINMDGINGPGILGSYGTGASPVFTNLYTGGSGVSDWRTMDLDFVRPVGDDLYTTAVEVVHPSSRFTFLRVKATGAGTGADGTFLTFAMNIFDTPSSVNQHVEHAIVDSEITDGRYAFYGAGDKLAFMGNYLYSSGDNQHVYRSFYANKGVNSNNTFAGGGDDQGWGPISLVKQHAPDQPGAYSEYLHWSDNRFAPTNVYVSLGFGSENSITDQRLRHVVVERNWFSAQYNAQLGVNMSSGYDYTVRNNLFVMDNFWGTGVQVQHTTTGPVTDQVEIYNNTFYKSDGGGDGMDAIQAMDSVTNVVIRNNLAYAPNASSPVMVSLLGGTTVTESNNSSDTQVRTVSPGFLSATPTTLAHFDLLAGSYARDAGYTVPVYSDLLDRLRPQGVSSDLGAIEGE